MSISFVNFSGGGQPAGPFTSATTAAQSVASGNSLVVGSRYPAASISDTAGNTYRPLGFTAWNFGGTNDGFQWYVCNNCVGKSNLQVTITLSGTGSDTYTAVGAWQFSGGPLVFDQMAIGQSGSNSNTQSVVVNPHYVQGTICLMTIVNALTTFGVNAPLIQDGGTSIAGNSIAGAEHAIFSSGFTQQTLSTTSGSSAAWFIGGPVFQSTPQIPTLYKRRIQEAALFTGREFDYFITLEKLWPLS